MNIDQVSALLDEDVEDIPDDDGCATPVSSTSSEQELLSVLS